MISRNLAQQQPSSRGSSLSCPDFDLSTLQLSLEPPESNPRSASEILERDTFSSRDNSPTQPISDCDGQGQRKHASTEKRVSRKARSILGKARSFHRIAAAKMSHSPIRVDIRAQTIKRGPPDDNDEASVTAWESEGGSSLPGLESGTHENVPPFLLQSDRGKLTTDGGDGCMAC